MKKPPQHTAADGRGAQGQQRRTLIDLVEQDEDDEEILDTVRQLTESIAQRIAHGVVADGRSDGSSP